MLLKLSVCPFTLLLSVLLEVVSKSFKRKWNSWWPTCKCVSDQIKVRVPPQQALPREFLGPKVGTRESTCYVATHEGTHPAPRSHAWHLSLVNTLDCCFIQNKRNSVRKAIFAPYGETLESPRKHWHTSYNLIKDSTTKEYNNCLNCAKLPTKHNKNSMHYKRSFNQRDICRYIPVTSNRS